MTETVQALVPLLAYQQSRAHLFASLESIRWYVKQNQKALVSAGALLTIAGRHMISPEQFDAAVLDIGKASAARKVAE